MADRLTARRADERDKKDLFTWRNDDLTRRMAIDQSAVRWEDHCLWWPSIQSPARMLFIVEKEEPAGGSLKPSKLGMCRFDLTHDFSQANVSLNLNPAQRGKGLAASVLRTAIDAAIQLQPRLERLVATIRIENLASQKTFDKAGFTRARSQEDLLTYVRHVTIQSLHKQFSEGDSD